MKKGITFFIVLIVVSVAVGQDKKTVRVNTPGITERYQIDKETKMKDGFFVRTNTRTKDTLVVGNYANNAKTGLWKYLSTAGLPYIDYNHSTHEVVYLTDDIKLVENFMVKVDSDFLLTKVDRAPFYLGDYQETQRILVENLRIPKELMEKKVNSSCYYTFVVNTQGKIEQISVLKSLSPAFDKQVVSAIQKLDQQWEPAIRNGEKVDARISLLINISDQDHVKKVAEMPFFYVMNLVYYSTTTVSRTSL